jgi:hypothetical protein
MENIWQATLDDRFDCRVTRINEAHGHLTVTDTTHNKIVLDQEVTLAYGARFGPDVDDVADWEIRCVQAVDGPPNTQ